MTSSASPPILLRTAETLAVAALGGLVFTAAGFPAGLISGSMLAVAIAAVMGRPVVIPLALARSAFVLLGILLGAVVMPETLKGIADWPLSIAILVVAAVCMIFATASYLRLVHGWDRVSAIMGASPGSLAQVMALSAEYGLDLRAIAIVQTTRVLILTVGLPGGLALFGLAATGMPARPSAAAFDITELAILVVFSAIVAMLWLRLPGGLLVGAMIGSGLLHGGGWVHAVLPWWIAGAAMITLGAVAGSRFANTTPRMLFGFLGAAFGSFAVAIAVASCFVLLVTRILPFPAADVVVAYAPGAQDTMMVLALALHLDPVFVGAHHLARFFVVTFMVAFLARRVAPKISAAPDARRRQHRRRGPFED
ncbi:MAG TPA: AbrB family transcriptional regulator [Xanthobacteraceae bacterium]|nr:AbrB family transcriptional regulator [Xanthobacteraceae bacterium]